MTHDVKVAARADKVLFMKDGAVVSDLFLEKSFGRDMNERMEKVAYHMAAALI